MTATADDNEYDEDDDEKEGDDRNDDVYEHRVRLALTRVSLTGWSTGAGGRRCTGRSIRSERRGSEIDS